LEGDPKRVLGWQLEDSPSDGSSVGCGSGIGISQDVHDLRGDLIHRAIGKSSTFEDIRCCVLRALELGKERSVGQPELRPPGRNRGSINIGRPLTVFVDNQGANRSSVLPGATNLIKYLLNLRLLNDSIRGCFVKLEYDSYRISWVTLDFDIVNLFKFT